MTRYALRRLALLIPTYITMSILLFVVIRVLPPLDPLERQLGYDTVYENPEVADKLRKELGISGPIWRQYINWAGGLLAGDFGRSLYTREPIIDEIKSRIPVSFELSVIGLFFTWVISFPLGILSALFQNRPVDYFLRGGAYLLDSIPGFIVAIFMVTYLAVYFNWSAPRTYSYVWDDPVRHLQLMILPTFIIGIGSAGNLIRLTRTFLLEVLRQDYVRTARAKGLEERLVITRHALRNMALPFVTVIGAQVPLLLTSSVIIEQLFSLPGMGRYVVGGIANLDYNVIMTTTMFFALISLAAQLIVDLSYAWLDPRVSYS